MTTVGLDDAVAVDEEPPRRSRWRRWLMIAIALVTVVAVVGSYVLVPNLRSPSRVELGSFVYGAPGADREVAALEGRLDGRAAHVYAAVPGRTFEVGFDITNRGDHAVTIVDLPELATDGMLVRVALDQSGPMDETSCCVPEEWLPFAPFELDPGEYRMIRMTFRVGDCRVEPPVPTADGGFGGGPQFGTHPVVLDSGWRTERRDVALPFLIALEGFVSGCADPRTTARV